MSATLIGIEYGWQDHTFCVALGEIGDESRMTLLETRREGFPTKLLADWIRHGPALLAFGSPLGWPGGLAEAVTDHTPGSPLGKSRPGEWWRPSILWRATDRLVAEKTKRRSEEVGIVRISRESPKALALLQSLRDSTGLKIPLSWAHEMTEPTEAIEVYVSATLVRTFGIRDLDFETPNQVETRKEIVERIGRILRLPADRASLESDPGQLNAAVCALTAGLSWPIYFDLDLMKREGWIWFGMHDE